MYFQQLSVLGEDFIGLLGLTTEKFSIYSSNFPEVKAFDLPVLRTKIYGTNLVGMFCAANSNGILLPYFTSVDDQKELKDFLDPLGVAIGIVEDKHTTIGNLVAANDKAALVSPKIGDLKTIEDTLGVEVFQDSLYGGHEEVGSCLTVTNKGLLAHPDTEKKLDELKELFKVKEGNVGSVNFGFPFVASGLIANTKGYITGSSTSGIEMGRIDEALGFI
ncbi:MAG: translation initiation factor IF-6 [Nanoarchaeota archaeon]